MKAFVLAVMLAFTAASPVYAAEMRAPIVKREMAPPQQIAPVPFRPPLQAKKVGMGEQIVRGAFMTFAIGMIVGIAKLGLLLIGIPVL